MTALQDRLTRAKDMALKILQDTVYQMVERIPECSNTAVQGAQLEGYIGFPKMRNGVEHWRFCQLHAFLIIAHIQLEAKIYNLRSIWGNV